jgi:hypothetical protein
MIDPRAEDDFEPPFGYGMFPGFELDLEKSMNELVVSLVFVLAGLLVVAILVIIELLTHVFSTAFRAIGEYIVTRQLQTLVYSIFAVLLLTSAVFLYRLRCRHRVVYGVVEVVFGTASILWAAQGLLDTLTGRSSTPFQLDAATTISLMGGLYIVIRGLNNVEEALGIKPGQKVMGRLRVIWLYVFHAPLASLLRRRQSTQPLGE